MDRTTRKDRKKEGQEEGRAGKTESNSRARERQEEKHKGLRARTKIIIFRNLFSYIDRYDTQNIEMETKFIPFIPEYIPSVGDTDPFIKVKSYYNQRNNFYVIMSNLT